MGLVCAIGFEMSKCLPDGSPGLGVGLYFSQMILMKLCLFWKLKFR